MTKKQLKKDIKESQKELARKIKSLKLKRKTASCGYVEGLDWYKRDYRYKHIAYCMFFNNTPYDLIERPRKDNKPSKSQVDGIKNQWKVFIDEEVICYSS